MVKAIGSIITSATAAQNSMVGRQPQVEMRCCEIGVRMIVPMGMPVATIPSAVPFRLTNHLFINI